MTPPSPSLFSTDGSGRRGTLDRGEVMIEGFRVGYEFGDQFRCVCAEFATRDSCKHTREVAGRLAAQGRIAEHLRPGASKAYSNKVLLPPRAGRLVR